MPRKCKTVRVPGRTVRVCFRVPKATRVRSRRKARRGRRKARR